jgi:hypothetical protein
MDDSLARRKAELEHRKADLERRQAEARAQHVVLQEEALMLVPQRLLGQVGRGAAIDFARIHEQMEATNSRELAQLVSSLEQSLSNPL